MNSRLPDLTDGQWDFLSVLHAFGEPVSIDIAGAVSPIHPGQFLDLLGRENRPPYVLRSEQENYSIDPERFAELDGHLKMMNTQERLNEIVDKLYSQQLIDKVGFPVLKALTDKLEESHRAAEIEISLAEMALKNNDEGSAVHILQSTIARLSSIAESPEASHYFVRAVIMLTSLWLLSGKNLIEVVSLLKKALKVSHITGDKRSQAILNLNLSTCYRFMGRDEDFWNAFSKGYQGIKDLGDKDILSRTAFILTLNLVQQGLYKEAKPHFETFLPPLSIAEAEEVLPFQKDEFIVLYGMCLVFLGEFSEAFGFLHFCWKRAKEESYQLGILSAKNLLGVALLILMRVEPAKDILESALRETKRPEYRFYLYILQFNLAYAYFLEGHFERAMETIAEVSSVGEELGTYRFPMAGYILEMVFELKRLGFSPDTRFNYDNQVQAILNGKDIDLKGTVLRLEAVSMKSEGKSSNRIEEHLVSSEKYLEQSGNRLQLGKTCLELARLNLHRGDEETAVRDFEKAYHCFGEQAQIFFPEDSKRFLRSGDASDNKDHLYRQRFTETIEAYDAISTSKGKKDTFLKCLRSICKIAGAERAGLFMLEKRKKPKGIHSTVLYNMTQKEIESAEFGAGKALIMKALETQEICIERDDARAPKRELFSIRSRCCLPLPINDGQWCVLYLDNSFTEDRYDDVDTLSISKLIRKAESRFGELSDDRQTVDPAERIERERLFEEDRWHDEPISENPAMLALIAEADRIASTESTVLITGETGTGKEVLAKRIHALSHRSEKPLVVVDLTAIPESLLESELFGHEKGAFTGADRQKIGRLELAHQGTLFLDEIGEIPLAFQVKLLRVLQEKKITRIGGAKAIPIDFRLITATNRDLENQVAAGRFRRDLYYRLNVVPISLPPLRERHNDIIVLAQHFLSEFQKRYNKPGIRLTLEDKTWLMTYDWPGNIRELRNIIERNVILSTHGLLNLAGFTPPTAASQPSPLREDGSPAGAAGPLIPVEDFPTLEEVQRRYIQLVLEKTGGKITGPGGAVSILGMKPSSLYGRMKRLGMR